MRGFIPSDPQDWHRTQIELMNWKADLDEAKKKQRTETRRYWITTAIAVLALVLAGISLAAQLGLIQLPTA